MEFDRMTYTPETWVDDDGSGSVGTAITAARMNNIESGIDDAHDILDWPMVKAKEATAVTCIINTITPMTLNDADEYDTHAMHSTASNTDRLTVPSGQAGIYQVSANPLFALDAT